MKQQEADAGPLERYGDFALAVSTRQPGLEIFRLPGRGELAWHPPLSPFGSALVLGDPLCAGVDREALLHAFLEEHPRAAFFQVGSDTALVLRELGLHATPMGFESWIELPGWHLRGQSRKYLRNVLSRASRQGISLHEWPDYRGRMDELQQISSRWLGLRRRNSSELHFLARPLDSCHDPMTRCFVARRNGHTIAFVMFDPLYRDGRVLGYAASLLRSTELGSAGWQDFIVLGAIEQFRREGLEWLTLGLSPFAPTACPPQLDSAAPTHALFSWWHRHGNWLYNFRGVGFHKHFYPSEHRPAFFCSRYTLPVMELRDALEAMNVSVLGRFNSYLWRQLERLSG